MKDPAVETARVIVDVMRSGSSKDGCDESWRSKPLSYHLGKGARHATYAFLMYVGFMIEDEEGWRIHLRNAITRFAMVLCYD